MNSINNGSEAISISQTANLIDAAVFADLSGAPLSHFLTFNLEYLQQRPQLFISRFTKLAGDWLRNRQAPCAYIWVLEWPGMKPLNCHLLFHVPDNLAKSFSRSRRRWVKLAGASWKKNFLVSQKIGIRRGAKHRELSDGERLIHTEWVLSYMLKGATADICGLLDIEAVPQGKILGKRVGVSQSLSRKARCMAGYKPPGSERGAILLKKRYRLGLAA